tara:strand:- start:345 stop:866 length:522 start_codon:yes stop_codon:yes gene_type:complete
MNILLLKKIKNLGDVGAEVSVKSGYARNYLFPKNLALPLTPENIEIVEKEKQELLKKEQELKDIALVEKDKYDNYVLTVDVNVKEEDVIYGSVNLQNILDKLKDDGFNLEKRQVNLPRGPIKVLGDDHIVTINLHSDVQVTIPVKLNVVQSDDDNLSASKNASIEESAIQNEE